MIVNVLRFSFKPEVPDEERAEVLAAMRRTASTEPVAFATVGQDLGDPAEGFTHAYLVGIPDLDALERYMHDPVHLAGDEYILGRLATLSAVRLSDDLAPDLGQKVYAMHNRKVEMYPQWGDEVANLFGTPS
ncbi:Dabb family protein [Pseudonocardia sp. CA-107938]|uniref:Dabb family protein n=1 Tax=Pseudonocardia sp. CA-107938 TaxID=3240021 RepID=UPI003D9465ED